jgi:hypothetical protein
MPGTGAIRVDRPVVTLPEGTTVDSPGVATEFDAALARVKAALPDARAVLGAQPLGIAPELGHKPSTCLDIYERLFDEFDRAVRRYAVDVIRKSSEASATERCPLGTRLGEAQTTMPSALPRRHRTAAGSERARLPDSNR